MSDGDATASPFGANPSALVWAHSVASPVLPSSMEWRA
jgi:hypothetical protein